MTRGPTRWSLRLRLVTVVAVLAAIGLAVVGALAVTLLRSYLVNQTDDQLIAVSHRFRGGSFGERRPGTGPTVRQPDGNLPTPFVLTVFSANGTLLNQVGGSTDIPRPNLTGMTAARARSYDGHPFTVASVSGGSRWRARAMVNPDGTVTVVALSLKNSDATVRRLELITLVVAAVVLAVLIAAATLLVRVGLRPLRVVEDTAERISGGDLSRRVPGAGANTEVGRLATTLNSMLGQIEAAFAARAHSEATLRQFIADASHELRTPLTTVRGYAELVNRGALPDPEQQRHATQRIEAEATRMGGLVDDLLLLAYLDQRRPLHTGPADLAALVRDAVADAQARAPQRRIDLDVPDEPVIVTVDADRMRQVLGNLLSNALTHTPPDTAIRLGLRRGADTTVLTVADDGPGIAPEQLPRLFERFYRGDPARSRASGGAGLGLSIVQAVVTALGGTVLADSSPGRGSTFTVTLPTAGS